MEKLKNSFQVSIIPSAIILAIFLIVSTYGLISQKSAEAAFSGGVYCVDYYEPGASCGDYGESANGPAQERWRAGGDICTACWYDAENSGTGGTVQGGGGVIDLKFQNFANGEISDGGEISNGDSYILTWTSAGTNGCNFSSTNGLSSGVSCNGDSGQYFSGDPYYISPGVTVTFRVSGTTSNGGIYDDVVVTNITGGDPATATVNINASSCTDADWSLSEDSNGDENNGTGSQSDILVAVDELGTPFTLTVTDPASGVTITSDWGGNPMDNLLPNANKTFSISCTPPPPPSAPTITSFTVNDVAGDIGISENTALTLAWTTSGNPTRCQFTSPSTQTVALSGSLTYSQGNANHPFPTIKSYTLECNNSSGTVEATRTVAAQVAIISVTSNVGAGWTINPGGITAVGTTGSHQVYPPPGGTTYVISGNPVTDYNAPTYTNSLTGAGNSMLILPGDDESFALNCTSVDNPPTTGSISAEDCGIPEGESTCNATVSWSLSNPV